MKRPLIPILLLALTAASAAVWWQRQNHVHREGPLTLYGNIEIRDSRLAFNEQEIVVEVAAEEGDVVHAGRLLARLRSDRLEDQLAEALASLAAQQQVVKRLRAGTRKQEIDQARSELEAARVRAHNSQKILERLQQTSAVGASSKQTLDDARAQFDTDQAQLDVRQKALDLAVEGPRKEDIAEAEARLQAGEAAVALLRHRVDDTVLKAPAAGVIQSRILEPGEMASPTRPAFVLALTDPKWARTYVPEPNLGLVREGMGATVSSDSWPGRKFTGRVGFISPEAEFTPKSVETTDLRTKLVYEVRVLVDDPKNELRLGMPVTVEIVEEPSQQDTGNK